MLQRPRRRCEGTAMGAIVLDLKPGLGIGPFSLGNSFPLFFFPIFLLMIQLNNNFRYSNRKGVELCESIDALCLNCLQIL